MISFFPTFCNTALNCEKTYFDFDTLEDLLFRIKIGYSIPTNNNNNDILPVKMILAVMKQLKQLQRKPRKKS